MFANVVGQYFPRETAMTRLTGQQIAAGMALAQMTQDQLAKAAGVGRNTLNRTINDTASTKDDTLENIRLALEARGVEFTEQNGVRIKSPGVDMLTGREGLRKFFDGVYEYARQHGGTIMMFGIDETAFIQTIGDEFSQNYLKRMTDISRTRGDLEVLAIICEGDTNFCASAYNKYRWISKDVFQAVPFYIYGETLAIMDFDTAPGPTIMMLKSRAITNAYRKQFQAFWKMASPPPSADKAGAA
jgi:transcriptional regulator with XRE-family HTH domain